MNSESMNNNKPGHASFFEKGMSERACGRIVRAIDFFTRSLAVEGLAAETFYNLGLAKAVLPDLAAARDCFSKAIDADPGYLRSYLMKGILHLAGNEYALAAAVLSECRPNAGNADIFKYTLTAAWLGAGDTTEAKRVFASIQNIRHAAEEFFEAWTDVFESSRTDCDRDGITVNYYPDGTEKQIFTYEKGVLNGEYVESHPSGKIKEYGFYSDGLREGIFTGFHPNGLKLYEKVFRKGVLDGVSKEFGPDGGVSAESVFSNGIPHGPARIFGPGGILREERQWTNGAISYSKEYNVDGALVEGIFQEHSADKKIIYEKKYCRGELHGPLKTFISENGRRLLLSEELYKHGRRDGKCRYYLNGKLREERNYANGSLNGISTTFYDCGRKYIEKNYFENLAEGPETFYTRDGETYMEYNYKNGLKQGHARIYAQRSNSKKYYLMEEKNYKNGISEGDCKIYNKNGILSEQWQYRRGKIYGRGLRFHENGKIRHEGFFIGSPDNGVKFNAAGLELFYDESGAITNIHYINSMSFI